MGTAGVPLNPMFALKVISLPPNVKAPAAEPNVRVDMVMPIKALLFTNRVLPAKARARGKMGPALLPQFPAVLQLLFAPPPVQRPVLMPLATCRSPEPVINPGRLPE